MSRQQMTLPGLRRPLRLVFLTDLHYGLYLGAAQVAHWVDLTLAERPDLVLLGGDFVDVHAGETPQLLLQELSRLRAPLGVLGVWGNHDYGSFGRYSSRWRGAAHPDWTRNREALAQALAGAGVDILRNQAHEVRDDLWLVGTDDLWWGDAPDLAALLAGAGERATLLLTHNPDLVMSLPAPVGLALAGHTHGGQVRIPGIGALKVPVQYRQLTQGWAKAAHGTSTYVSRGLGVSALPLRFACPAEITVLTLLPA
ncbi:metallophosphoesterase [Deinococcus lacus]|uniref:Metallophosphoesterase n=1 Tax=Deinococcus lacus TaxID=392561 RepID=A0ABW1YC91_9DEIO